MDTLLDYFTQQTEGLATQVEKLVGYPSPSQDKKLVDALGAYLHTQLQDLGATVGVFPRQQVGDMLLAKWEAPGTPILLLGHMDTVWKAENSPPTHRDAGRLFGAGALDMKAGIAIALETIRGLRARGAFPARPVWLLLTSDEETGSEHSRELILETARQCGLVLVLEPAAENEGLKTSRKGIGRYWVAAHGTAAHAGNAPEEGVNAIIELAHQAITLHKLNQLRRGTSVSVTQIEGGTAGNVIPAQARLYVDVRFFDAEEAERVDSAIKNLQPALFGSQLAISGGIGRLPMERDAMIVRAYQQAKAIAAGLGLPLPEAAVGGVSDANLTAAAGIPTLDGLGGQGDGMHAQHEHVLIRSLPRRAALLAALLQNWAFE